MIQVDQLAGEIIKALTEYSDDVAEATKKAVDVVGKEVDEEIKRRITFNQNTKKYVRSFKIKTTEDGRFNRGKTWHVANGQHRKTHLLEHGHATRSGGRTRAFPHIRFGEELAQRRLPELVEEGIKNVGR